MPETRKIFAFDTNVLLSDPAAIFRFMEHDIFIPMTVLEELDAAKKGVSDLARSAREVSRRLDSLIKNVPTSEIEAGIPLGDSLEKPTQDHQVTDLAGRLFLQTFDCDGSALPSALPGNAKDNQILASVVALSERFSSHKVTLLTNDINLRIKAQVLGIHSEDFYNDKLLEDADVIFPGYRPLITDPQPLADTNLLEIVQLETNPYSPNEGLLNPTSDGQDYLVSDIGARVKIRPTISYFESGQSVWGINARNREQNFALNLLMDPSIDFVSLLGAAGTGKTLLALAAGLTQTLDSSLYQEIIVTRETISLGEDIGFLPGTEEEKMTPWMGALVDNLEVLNTAPDAGEWGKAATMDLLHKRIKIRSMGFMRGRTFTNRYVIVDEAQNMTAKQMRAIVSRAGPGTKLVCLGNVGQIDSPYLSESTSGLTYVVKKFRRWPHSGHITLQQGERSRLAEFAATNL